MTIGNDNSQEKPLPCSFCGKKNIAEMDDSAVYALEAGVVAVATSDYTWAACGRCLMLALQEMGEDE